MSDTEKTTREFKPKGKPPRHRRRWGWQPGDVSKGHMLTRTGVWIPLAPEDRPAPAVRPRVWLSVILVIMIIAIAVWMGAAR